jgi:hypothetical protein
VVAIVSVFPDSSSATPLRPAWFSHGSTRMPNDLVMENLIELHRPSGPPTDPGQLVGAGNHDRDGGRRKRPDGGDQGPAAGQPSPRGAA